MLSGGPEWPPPSSRTPSSAASGVGGVASLRSRPAEQQGSFLEVLQKRWCVPYTGSCQALSSGSSRHSRKRCSRSRGRSGLGHGRPSGGCLSRPPMRARHGTYQVETLPAAIGHVLDVLGPREVTVEDDSQELDAALVEHARGPQLQRQMGWPSSVAAEFHGDCLGCGHIESPLVEELLEPVEVGLEVSPVDVWVGPSSPDGAVIRVEGELDAVLWLRYVVHHDDEQHRADDAALRRSVHHKEQIGQLRSDAHTDVSVGEEVPDPVEHVAGDVVLLQLVQQAIRPHQVKGLLEVYKYTTQTVFSMDGPLYVILQSDNLVLATPQLAKARLESVKQVVHFHMPGQPVGH